MGQALLREVFIRGSEYHIDSAEPLLECLLDVVVIGADANAAAWDPDGFLKHLDAEEGLR